MYEIVVEQTFEAAHYLRGYKGKCENLHGHQYTVVVRLKAERLNEIGLAYDFTDIKSRLRGIIGKLDHTELNRVPPFDRINPSAENIATSIFYDLKPALLGEPVQLAAVEVWENPHQGAVFTPD